MDEQTDGQTDGQTDATDWFTFPAKVVANENDMNIESILKSNSYFLNGPGKTMVLMEDWIDVVLHRSVLRLWSYDHMALYKCVYYYYYY